MQISVSFFEFRSCNYSFIHQSSQFVFPKGLFSKYELSDELGRGAFSIVKLGKEKGTGARVAVKIIEKKNVAQEYRKNLATETEILRKVHHPSIIHLIEMFETDEFLFLVMELVVGGELFDRIVEKVRLILRVLQICTLSF